MRIHLSFTFKLAFAFVIFSALMLGIASALAYINGQAGLETAAVAELYSAAIEKQAGLNAWVGEAQNYVSALSASPAVQEQTASLMAARTAGDLPAAQAAHDRLAAELRVWVGKNTNFLEWMVLDAQSGQVVAATTPGNEGKFREDQPYFTNGQTGPYVQNLYYSSSEQSVRLTASAPIRSRDGRLLGVLAGNLDLAKMTAIIARRTGLRQSVDSFLVNTSELLVTQPRFISDPAVLLRGIHTPAVKQCLAHNSGTIKAPDYRGIPSIIVYRWLPERQLCLIVKINQAEAFAPALALRNNIALVSLLALLGAVLLAYWLARSITQPVQQLVQAAHAIGAGQLDVPIAVKTGDEIGDLARALAQMAKDLKETLVSRSELLIEVTERKKMEEQIRQLNAGLEVKVEQRTAQLRDSLELNQKIIDTSSLGIFACREDGPCIIANPTVARISGAPVEKMLQLNFRELETWKKNGLFDKVEAALATGEEQRAEVHLTTTFGRDAWLNYYITTFTSVGKLHFLMMVEDITQRKQAEEELVKYRQHLEELVKERTEDLRRTLDDLTRSNAELERFAYVASHDLQEPLRMVASYLQLLERRYKGQLDQNADEFINYAVDGANRMKTLINDLLAYSRVGTRGKEFALTGCEAVLAQVLNSLQISIAENDALVTHDPLPKVMGDEVQLESLFQNLLGNALKFRSQAAPRIHVGVAAKDSEWVFSVRDNGIGIEPRYFERIFIIFQRLHGRDDYPGTGIGLAISKRIVERHGGRMWIESQPGKGATFYFTLPMIGELQ